MPGWEAPWLEARLEAVKISVTDELTILEIHIIALYYTLCLLAISNPTLKPDLRSHVDNAANKNQIIKYDLSYSSIVFVFVTSREKKRTTI